MDRRATNSTRGSLPVFLRHRLCPDSIGEWLGQVTGAPWSYSQIGATRFGRPAGYSLDQLEVNLGAGRTVFEAARQIVADWGIFPAEICRVYGHNRRLEPGNVFAINYNWGWLNALGSSRVVYRVDEPIPAVHAHRGKPLRAQFGFACGTLTHHFESGEERFVVAWRADNRVVYTIESFVRPQHWLSRCAYPYFRSQRRRFHRLSIRAMQANLTAILDGRPPVPSAWRTIATSAPASPVTTRGAQRVLLDELRPHEDSGEGRPIRVS